MVNDFIENLKKAIRLCNTSEVTISSDGTLLTYNLPLSKITLDVSINNANTLGELGRALAIATLISQYKVPAAKIRREVGSPVGSPSKRIDTVIELDETKDGRKCIALVECKTSLKEINNKQFADYVKRQLYNIALSYAGDPNKPYPMVLILCEVTPPSSVNFTWTLFPAVESAFSNNLVSSEAVFSQRSPYMHSQLPDFTNGLYFSQAVYPLTKDDLVEIDDAHALKVLLNDRLHQTLRKYGIVENDAFFIIMNLLLAKIQDEITADKQANYQMKFQVLPQDYDEKNEFYNRINSLYQNALMDLLGEFADVARTKDLLVHENKEDILLDLVPQLQSVKIRSIRLIQEDIVGDVFLDFMHSMFRQSRGMFFTHPNIATFVCKALGLQHTSKQIEQGNYVYVLDPSCGSGTFLIEAMKCMFKDSSLNDIGTLAKRMLFGIDNNEVAVTLCKVNMVAHGDGSANIIIRDALSPIANLSFSNIKLDTIEETDKGCTRQMLKDGSGFHYIVTNPPFSLMLKSNDSVLRQFVMSSCIPYKSGATAASECLFIERWYQLLRPKGKVGAVLPISIFDSFDYAKARQLLLCYFRIYAIVGLPEHAFSPHAQQKTVLMFAEKRTFEESNKLFKLMNTSESALLEAVKNEHILFYDAQNIGYVRKKKQKAIRTEMVKANDLTDDLADEIYEFIQSNGNATCSIGQIRSIEDLMHGSDFNLSPVAVTSNKKISSKTFTLDEEWEVVSVEPVNFDDVDLDKALLCETGDIAPNGYGILLPKSVQGIQTTTSNKERIGKKLLSGKFGKLRAGDIVIAPVRTYQKKIAVITPSAERFLYSKDFIVLRRKGEPNLLESFKLFLKLIDDENTSLLSGSSSTGKSGYPKIKDRRRLLDIPFVDKDVSDKKALELTQICENIYNIIVLQ